MGRARAQAKHVFLGYDTNKKDAQRPYDPFAGGIAPRSLLRVRKRRFLFLSMGNVIPTRKIPHLIPADAAPYVIPFLGLRICFRLVAFRMCSQKVGFHMFRL